MLGRVLLVFLLMLVLFAGACRGATGRPGTPSTRWALDHVTVIDVVRGTELGDRAIVVAGDRIEAVVAGGNVPSGTRIVDARGKYVIPGLWDMHVHFAEPAWAKLYVANGVTGIRVMWGNWHLAPGLEARKHDAPDAVGDRLHFELRDAFESGRAVGPHMAIASDILDGAPPVWPHSVAVRSAMEGRAAVAMAQQNGADFIKVYSRLSKEAYDAIADESRKRGLPFVGHVPDALGVGEVSDAGQKSIEHLDGMLLACSAKRSELEARSAAFIEQRRPAEEFWRFRTELALAAAASYDDAVAAPLFAKFVANGTWHCPTLSVSRAGSSFDDPSKLGMDDRMVYVPAPLRHYWSPSVYPSARGRTPADYTGLRQVLERRLAIVGAMSRAGVGLLAGTDETNPYCFAGFGLHDELELFVRAGLTPAEALRTATINPAKFFGRVGAEGSVEAGLAADLVVLDASPLVEIANTRRIHAVILRGEAFDRAALDRLLTEVKAEVAAR